MSEVKSIARSFGDTKSIELGEERMLRVIATAPTLDRDLDVLDSKTARVPIKPRGWKYAQDLTVEDDIDIPFLVDHDQWNGIQKQAGSVKKMYINESGELEAIVKLSTVELGEHVYTLAKEGHLGNSFSIGFSLMNATEDQEAIKNYEITELSAVFKGSNRDARLLEVKSVKQPEVETEEDKTDVKTTETATPEVEALKSQIAELQKQVESLTPVEEAPVAEEESTEEVSTEVDNTEEDAPVADEAQEEVAESEEEEAPVEVEEPATESEEDESPVDVREEATKTVHGHLANIKGLVREVAEADHSWETEDEKWEEMQPVRALFNALQEAWFFSTTPLEAFESLVAEFAELVKALISGTDTKAMSEELTTALGGKTVEDVQEAVKSLTEKPAEEATAESEGSEDESESEDEEIQTENNTDTNIEEKSTMTKQKEVAKSQVAPADRAEVAEAATTASAYLGSKSAMRDFAGVLKATAGQTPAEVKSAWAKHLEAKGITNPEVLLPTTIRNKIVALLESEGPIWTRLNKTGAKAFRVLIDESDADADTSRAGGHTRGDVKDEQVITLAPRLIRSQMIYKFIRIDRETEFEDDGALMDYVATELPKKIIAEIERAVVIGDGRASNHKRKIREIKSIREDATSGDGYAKVYTPTPLDTTNYKKFVRAEAELETEGARILVAKKTFVTDLSLQENANGGLVFAPGSNLAAALGLEAIYTPNWMKKDTDNDAYVFVPDAYLTVGQSDIEAFSDFKLETNQYEYLQEIFVGGALSEVISGVAIAAVSGS